MRNPLSCCLWAMAGCLLPTFASAQYSMLDDHPPRFEWRGQIETDFRNEFKAETDGGDQFESWRVGIGGDFGGPINQSMLVGVSAAYRFASYEFHLDNGPSAPAVYAGNELPRDPWGDISMIDIAPNATILVGDQFSVIAAVPIRWSAETGARRNAFAAGISAIGRWQITDDLRIGAGIGVTSQLEDDAETFPIVSLDWQISDAFALRTEGSWIQGGNATLLWGPNQTVRLSLSAGYERVRFRLDDNGSQIDRNGIGEIRAVPVELGLRFHFYEGAFFDFRFGLNVAGRLRVENDNGRKLYDQDHDPAPRIGIGLTIPFGLPARPNQGPDPGS
jgi:hypothetical protein